jgi:zinc transport system substrate-binding protein
MRTVTPMLSALLPLSLALTGCSAFSDDAGDGDGTVAVTAAFYPLSYASDRVAGDLADVTLLTRPGGEPHDLELSVAETAEIAEADLVVYEAEFQPAVDEAVEQNAEGAALDAAEVVDLLHFGESEEEHAEHSDEEDHADEGDADEEGHDHDHGESDPHFWHDPLRMADLGDALADDLAEIDPDHADDYRSNAETLRTDMERIDEQFATGLADCERTTVVTSHDAFGYLEKYGVEMESIAGLSPDAEPTPAHIGELQQLVRSEGLTTVFTERLAPSEWSDTLAGDLGIETAVLDPIEGLDDQTADEDYASLMASNLEALRAANGCR